MPHDHMIGIVVFVSFVFFVVPLDQLVRIFDHEGREEHEGAEKRIAGSQLSFAKLLYGIGGRGGTSIAMIDRATRPNHPHRRCQPVEWIGLRTQAR